MLLIYIYILHHFHFLCVFVFLRGVYEFQAKATINRTVLSGPKIRVSIQPDPMKPRELLVDCSKNASFVVGQKMPGEFYRLLRKLLLVMVLLLWLLLMVNNVVQIATVAPQLVMVLTFRIGCGYFSML